MSSLATPHAGRTIEPTSVSTPRVLAYIDGDDFDCCYEDACLSDPESICDDGVDNDEDGFTDCEDFDCTETMTCCDAEHPMARETGPDACADGEDNDCDGYTDCDDHGCRCDLSLGTCDLHEADCADGLDNDDDGYTDCDDIDCLWVADTICDCAECTNDACSNGTDDDGDDRTDCDDWDCQYSLAVTICDGDL